MIKQLQKEAYETAKANGHDVEAAPVYHLKGIAGEVVEAMEAFEDMGPSYPRSELADIVIRTMTLAESENIDLQQAILDKMAKNKERANADT